tara:strand:- start:1026 stop:1262 length:237 start_codon:yes stop_codon:yes gene_type:complete
MIPTKQFTQNETLKTLEPEFDAIETLKEHAYYKEAMNEKERLEMIDRVEAIKNETKIETMNNNLKELKLRVKRKNKRK